MCGGGGGTGSDECTASRAQVLSGYTAVTSDSDDELATGTMANNGGMSASLNCGQSKSIPAGYTSGGTVTANSLASQTSADATAAYIYSGKTAWVNGSKLTGSMTCSSLLSFSVAAYSTSQVLCGWQNPAKGPFSGVLICAKTGGYPSNQWDNRVYTGAGDNTAASGISSTIISGLTAGTTYYFRIWAYTNCTAGDFYSGYREATCAPTSHGRQAFTSSGTFTVPSGVRSINIHCTGGGSKGCNGDKSDEYAGGGGGGGYCSWKTGISVSPGNQIVCTVGAGGTTDDTTTAGSYAPSSTATLNGTTLVTAQGGFNGNWSSSVGHTYYGKDGGNQGGSGATFPKTAGTASDGAGGSDSTKEFGSGTSYSGGGGGGGGTKYYSSSEYYISRVAGSGGAGGGGKGSGYSQNITSTSGTLSYYICGAAGTAGTGGGGGGGSYIFGNFLNDGQNGGSGNVIITW